MNPITFYNVKWRGLLGERLSQLRFSKWKKNPFTFEKPQRGAWKMTSSKGEKDTLSSSKLCQKTSLLEQLRASILSSFFFLFFHLENNNLEQLIRVLLFWRLNTWIIMSPWSLNSFSFNNCHLKYVLSHLLKMNLSLNEGYNEGVQYASCVWGVMEGKGDICIV